MTNYPTYKLGEILSYEQPTNYIVESTEYDDSYPTPVLTAGKSFILGYTNETKGVYDKLPVIIFDDFTTASQFVDFKFKVKSSAMKILSCNEEIADIKYMYYLMQITHIQSDTHKRYWISDYSKIPVFLPPLPIQHAIVSRIESLFAELDKAEEHLRTAQQQLKTYRQAVLNHWLNNDDGKWKTVKLGEVTSSIGDGIHGTPKYDDNGKYYFINGGNLTVRDIVFIPGTKRVNESEYKKYKVDLSDKTVLLSINGSTLGKRTAFYNNEPIILGKSACYINVKECLDKHYLRHFLSSDIFYEYAWKYKTGAAIPNLGLRAIRDFHLPLPPLAEQQRIVNEIESRLSQATASETYIENALQQAEALRQSILKKAFSGELV